MDFDCVTTDSGAFECSVGFRKLFASVSAVKWTCVAITNLSKSVNANLILIASTTGETKKCDKSILKSLWFFPFNSRSMQLRDSEAASLKSSPPSGRFFWWFWHFQYPSSSASKVCSTRLFLDDANVYVNIMLSSTYLVVQEYERAVIFRMGKNVILVESTSVRSLTDCSQVDCAQVEHEVTKHCSIAGTLGRSRFYFLGPGVFFVLPCIDNYCKVDLRTVCKHAQLVETFQLDN